MLGHGLIEKSKHGSCTNQRVNPTAQTQYPAAPVVQECTPHPQFQYPPQNCWPPQGPGRRGDIAQYQQRFAPQRPYNFLNRARIRKCVGRQQSDIDYCAHCYRCGSSEYFLAGCRMRVTRQNKDGPLNERGLPPRYSE